MCTQKPPHDYSAELYARYGQAFSAYISERVLPALKGHSGEFLLNELWTRWSNHKLMVRWLSRFFNYLDRYYIARHTMHSLPEVGLMRFRDEVYAKVKGPARDALLAAVAAERAGEGVNRPLLKNVLSIFIECGMGSMDCYQRDFEAGMVEATKEHYARVAAAWVSWLFLCFLKFFPSFERAKKLCVVFPSSGANSGAKKLCVVFPSSGANSGAKKLSSVFFSFFVEFFGSFSVFPSPSSHSKPKTSKTLNLRSRGTPALSTWRRPRPPSAPRSSASTPTSTPPLARG